MIRARRSLASFFALALGASACAGSRVPLSGDALEAAARPIHDRVMTLDTHVDFDPDNFLPGQRNYAGRLSTQVDLTTMEEGGLDAVFFSVYVGQGPLDSAGYARAYATDTAKFNAIHRLAGTLAPSRIGIAYTADDARRIYASGRKVALLGVENGYGIGTDLRRVKEFFDRGARYMSLSHNGHSQLSDSNTGEATGQWMWNGLSPLGRQVIGEMNRWGIMIDASHPSKAAIMQMLELSRAPIIASHSSVRALCNHSRNLDDEQLRGIAKGGGVVQVVAFRAYLKCDPAVDAARIQALTALNHEFGITSPVRAGAGAAPTRVAGSVCPAPAPRGAAADPQVAALPASRREQYDARMQAVLAQHPPMPRATVGDFVDHIDYAVKLIGIDHVGISSDFDGGGGVEGWNCALESINVTRELVRRGYSEEQIGKLWSGNLLRVMGEVERVARRIQGQ